MKKLAHRFEYRLSIKDRENNTLLTGTKFNETLQKTIDILNRNIGIGENVDKSQFPDKLKAIGFKDAFTQKEGRVGRIELIVIFRKG